jgi:hypothetical protein
VHAAIETKPISTFKDDFFCRTENRLWQCTFTNGERFSVKTLTTEKAEKLLNYVLRNLEKLPIKKMTG